MAGPDEIKKPTVSKTEAEVVYDALEFVAKQLSDAEQIRNELVLEAGEEELRLRDLMSVQKDLDPNDDLAKENAALIADYQQGLNEKMAKLKSAQDKVTELIYAKEAEEAQMQQKRN
ncbi:hypothetical protein A3A38_00780 [Candidatus Kaiserbacteria bacterium RIFCSPLOWO2_01_FULL_53_17]|uniref:Uncharacterized protein n=1 Tax=Candidatus Kaiserbacteria bacterium RIFCSPLOWO2_01_FULL_53_17 TaxID=1798511 RepID=A0A1F6EGD7_9BACT|nr:MAG: hypothetical protein A3A38_00780 [Candidatus Kaiserbacteria bacterium RIFCSPLOWO2_01_FULL_53_17]